MSIIFRACFCYLCIVLIVGCGEGTDTSTTTKNESTIKSKSAALSATLKSIFQTNKGVFRGNTMNASMSEVRNQESAKLLKSSTNELHYTIDVKEGIFADIVYVFRGGMLFEIKLDVFTKSRRESNRIYNDLTSYFNKIYKERKSLWDGNDGKTEFTIFCKQVGQKSGNHGVYVVWEQI